jgi:hypothetical protein
MNYYERSYPHNYLPITILLITMLKIEIYCSLIEPNENQHFICFNDPFGTQLVFQTCCMGYDRQQIGHSI